MIYSLRGKLIFSDISVAVVECGGVGYKCTISAKTLGALPETGKEVMLYTHMNVREDAVDLFGFISMDEMRCFKLLISVNGVGAKMGIALLSEFTPEFITSYIASGDYKALTAASGVGPKLAQRIVLELKDKVGSLGVTQVSSTGNTTVAAASSDNIKNAATALVSLGFLQSEANRALAGLDINLSTEELIKAALAKISSGKF
ncbi:MAG: Holliday junction branch migration protein RuvA [Clostridia bacterium]|nr:Holliday junction branch migration protein RuvA [Clostridia bacterium]